VRVNRFVYSPAVTPIKRRKVVLIESIEANPHLSAISFRPIRGPINPLLTGLDSHAIDKLAWIHTDSRRQMWVKCRFAQPLSVIYLRHDTAGFVGSTKARGGPMSENIAFASWHSSAGQPNVGPVSNQTKETPP
jgi:hypothetical protein